MTDFPKTVLIDNASYCNLRCSMCDYKNISNYRRKQVMPEYLHNKLIDEIAQVAPNTRVWEIFFGDPFCCPGIEKRVRYAKSKGLTDVVLNSNGNAMYEKRANALIYAGLDAMYVGIDAASKEVYDKIRIGGKFDTVVKNVLSYKNLLIKHGNKEQKLFVQFVVCDENEIEMNAFIDFWKKEDVSVKIRPKVSWGGLISANNLVLVAPRSPCKWAMESFAVCADGIAAFCAVDIHCQLPVGNCASQTIEHVWNSVLRICRQYQEQGKYNFLPDFCKNCLDWQSARCDYI